MKVISNLAISIDGKIATSDRQLFWVGSKKDHTMLLKIRNQADAILMGSEVLRTFKNPCLRLDQKVVTNIIYAKNFKNIDFNWPFFKSNKIKRVIVITGKASQKIKNKINETCHLIDLSGSKNTETKLLSHLKTQGIRTLLVEGGGVVMWQFLKNNQIDELFLTVCPRVIGGKDAPTLVDGEGFSPKNVVNLKLVSAKRVKSELFLKYKKLKKRGAKHPEY